jgi:hypothetical protein
LKQYDPVIQAEAAKHGIDPAFLYASMAIESGGYDVPNAEGAPNRGVLQVWDGNAKIAADHGYDISTAAGQIGFVAAIAAGDIPGMGTGSTPEERIMSVYPGAGGSAEHVAEYNRDWNAIVDMYHQAEAANGGSPPIVPGGPIDQPGGVEPGTSGPVLGTGIDQPGGIPPGGGSIPGLPGGTTPAVIPETTPAGPGTADPRGAVVYNPQDPSQNQNIDASYVPGGGLGAPGGEPNTQPKAILTPQTTAYLETLMPGAAETFEGSGYGFGSPDGCTTPDGHKCYGNYWGWDPNYHPGDDVFVDPTQATPFNNLIDGKVVCVGMEDGGNSAWTAGCGAYPDYSVAGSPGNITVQTADNSTQVTYGHTSALQTNADGSPIVAGQEVTTGDPLGMTGSMSYDDAGNLVGFHTHLEVRLALDPNDPGKFTLVDPTVYFNNGYCQADGRFCAYGPASETVTPDAQASAPAQNDGYYTGGVYVPPASKEYAAYPSYSPTPAQQTALPPPDYYQQSGGAPATTGQVTTDASGKQYEVRPDGTLRLIYDPAW